MGSVLIYGFGWYGKMLFSFCKKCGIPAKVIDDSASVDEKYAENIDSLDKNFYSVFVIAIGNKQVADEMEKKLLNMGIDSQLIKIFAYDFYIPKSVAQKYASENKVDLADFLRQDSKYLDGLKSKIVEMKDFYYKERENDTTDYNIFQRMMPAEDSKGIMYPYFFTSKAELDSEFGFREAIDIASLAASGKRIICFLGNCVSFGGDFGIEDSIPKQVEKRLCEADENIVVLNCSVYGATIGEQMSYYIWILRLLKPEVVVSFFGYELLSAFTSCEKMLSKYKFFYHTFVEKINKDYMHSDIPLYGETFRLNTHVERSDVLEAISYRLAQFEQIVTNDNTKFVSVLQPFFCKKQFKTESELQIFEESRLTVVGGVWDLLSNHFEEVVDDFVDKQDGKNSFLDTNTLFYTAKGEIFRGWLALTIDGNRAVADLISKKLEQVIEKNSI